MSLFHTRMQNFLALAASGYYNDCLFHRNIREFMIQTGDPMGTGKGGTSIWGRKFEDEFHETLKVSVLIPFFPYSYSGRNLAAVMV